MTNEIFLDLITSEFTGEEQKEAEYSAVLGFALDSIKRKENLEGIYRCYVPFYGLRVSDNNYIIVNSLNTDKNKLSVSKVPTIADIKPVLTSEYNSLESLYKDIENALISKSVHNVEISGALIKKSVEGMAKLITHHGSSRNQKFKKLSSIVNREDVKRQVVSISKYAITDHELETELNLLFDEVEKSLESEIENRKRERSKAETEYSQLIENSKRETSGKIKEIDEEEKVERKKIDEEASKNRQDQVHTVKESKRWNQLKKDIAALTETYTQLLNSLDRLSSGDDFDLIYSKIRAVQDETQSFGVGLNTALSEIDHRKNEFDDIFQQAEVDKRNVSDRMNTVKEDIRRQTIEIENEKTQVVSEKEADIQLANDILNRFHNNRSNLMKKIKNNYIMFSAYSISGDLLNITAEEQAVTINVPVAICKFKEKDKLNYLVIPPFEISERMKKPRLLPLHSLYARIGFDCIASESISFLKKPLEDLLEVDQKIQGEIQADTNELIKEGDLSLLNSGLNLLEQKKKLPKKYADEILSRSRSFLS